VSETSSSGVEAEVVNERRRELAVEHLLFQTIAYVEERHPGLIARLEASLDHLGDSARDETKDDEAVRDIARLFIKSLRSETAGS
jgi:hypothetical protein